VALEERTAVAEVGCQVAEAGTKQVYAVIRKRDSSFILGESIVGLIRKKVRISWRDKYTNSAYVTHPPRL